MARNFRIPSLLSLFFSLSLWLIANNGMAQNLETLFLEKGWEYLVHGTSAENGVKILHAKMLQSPFLFDPKYKE